MGLGFSLILGITTILGTLFPLFLHPASGVSARFVVGLVLLVIGLLFCSIAGSGRERQLTRSGRQYVQGVLICVVSGVLSSLMNLGIVLAAPVQAIARESGASPIGAANVFWPLFLAGGFAANLLYCSWRLSAQRTWKLFHLARGSEWSSTMAMGAAWFGGTFLYGTGAAAMGPLGPALGWPIYISLLVITAYVLGMFAGEWRGSPAVVRRWMKAGIAVMVASTFLIAESRS
jgi:L-rhamnose-H+ transport protein